MNRWVLIILATAGIGSLGAGCYPEKRVVWSPDGRWAAVLGGDGLHVSDADGKLTPLVAAGATRAAWLPDSRRLVVTRPDTFKTWSELAPQLPEPQRERIIAAGKLLHDQILAFSGDWDAFEPKGMDDLTGGERAAVLLCMRDQANEGLPEKLGERWDELKELQVELWSLQLCDVAEGGAKPGATLCRMLDEQAEPRVAPDGKKVAFTAAMPGEKPSGARLYVVAAEGGRLAEAVADDCAWFPDWSADSRYLIYVHAPKWKADEEQTPQIGLVARRAVADAGGALLDMFMDPQELARVMFQPEIKVRALKDGRIIFSGVEQHLPATLADSPERYTLFAINPEQAPVVLRIVPREAEGELPKGRFYFEVSPEDRYIALLGRDGQVTLLTPATGQTWSVLAEAHLDSDRVMMVTWRSADELCYIGPTEDEARAGVMLLKLNWAADPHASRSVDSWEKRDISGEWPEAVARGFLLPEPSAEENKD